MSRLADSLGIQNKNKIVMYGALGVMILVGSLVYGIFAFFSHLNQTVMLEGLSANIANVMVLSPQAVRSAEMKVAMNCTKDVLKDDGSLEDPTACSEAKANLKVMVASNDKVQATKADLFNQGVQTKKYYSGWVVAVQEKPFYYIVLLLLVSVFSGGLFYWVRRYKANQEGEEGEGDLV